MSIKLMSRIWDDAPYEKTALLVLLCLADMADDSGVCWPSVETIARKARCTTRWVRDILVELENNGHVSKELRTGQTTKYHVHCPAINKATPEPQFSPEESSVLKPSSAPHPGSGVQGGDEVGFPNPGSGVQPNHKEPSIEPERVVTSPVRDDVQNLHPDYTRSISRVKEVFNGNVAWHPDPESWATAVTLYPEADPGTVVIEYIMKNRGKGAPNVEKWLSWVAQAHKQATTSRMEIEAKLEAASKPKPKEWWHTAADD